MYVKDTYHVLWNDRTVGWYSVYSNGSVSYDTAWGSPWDIGAELKALGLDQKKRAEHPVKPFSGLIRSEHRVPGRKRILYRDGPITLERQPKETGTRFSVYRRAAEKGAPDYSPLPHDAPHHEGPHTPKGMREWASWYAFNKMDDGTYEAELDEAWCWGGGHNDGGTIHREIPEEWFSLPYEAFLGRVVDLASASHYGFTAEQLAERDGLRAFFGFTPEEERSE